MKAIFFLCALVSSQICGAAQDISASELLSRAVSLAAGARLDEAEQLLLKGRSEFPNDARFPVELAGVAWRKKQSALAKVYLRQGLRVDASNAYANEFLGSLYLLDGNLYAALKYLNRVRSPVLDSVIFTPEPPLRPELLARISGVSAGQLLTPMRLAQTERNLDRFRVFRDTRFDLTPVANGEYRLAIRAPVLSQPFSGVGRRLLPLLRGLPYQQINLDWPNIEQSGASFTSLWRWDGDKRRITAKYRAPLTTGAFALWTDLRDEHWDLDRSDVAPGVPRIRSGELGGELELDAGGGKRWTPSVHLSRHTFRNGGSRRLFSNSTVWELRNRFDLARWRYPERRLQIDSSATLRTGRVFSVESSRLVGVEFDGAMQWLPQERDDAYSVHARLRGGALSGHPPVDKLYATAMERDNDLWLRGHTGTRRGRKGNAPMGTRFALAQTEAARRLLRVPFLRLDAGPFFDIANIGGVTALGSRGWLYDAGAQAVLTILGGFHFSIVYGRDIRGGKNVLYTAFSR